VILQGLMLGARSSSTRVNLTAGPTTVRTLRVAVFRHQLFPRVLLEGIRGVPSLGGWTEGERPPPEGRGTTELMVEAVELGVVAQAPAPAQDPGAALHPLAPAREELLGVRECQHPVLGVDLDLGFHHHLHPLSFSTGLKATPSKGQNAKYEILSSGHQLLKLGSSLPTSVLRSLKPTSLHSRAAQVFVLLTALRCGGQGRGGQEVVQQQHGSTLLDLLPSVRPTLFLFESLILFSSSQNNKKVALSIAHHHYKSSCWI